MDFEKWWFNNEANLDFYNFYNFEKEEAEKVWNAAIDSADKIAMDYHISQVGRNNAGLVIANKIKELKS